MTTQTPPAALMSTTIMTPAERSMGRLMRAPDDHPSGAGDGNNGAENNQPGTTDSGTTNNDGQALDLKAFWEGSPDGEKPGPSGESDQNPKPSGGQTPAGEESQVPDLGKLISETVFGSGVTAEIMEKAGEGDFTGLNASMTELGRNVMRQTLVQSVGIMRELRTQLLAEMDSKLEGRITGDRQYDALVAAIPSAGKPEMGPTIKGVYERALKNTKGDIPGAIQMTKQVMQMQAELFGGDLNLTVAPKTAADNLQPPRTENWLESLA